MPDNASYYYIAYTAASALYVAYALVLSMKRKRLRVRARSVE